MKLKILLHENIVILHLNHLQIYIKYIEKEKWNRKDNSALFVVIFSINIIYLIFSIDLRYWCAKNLIKDEKRNIETSLSISGFSLLIIHFNQCIIEKIVFIVGSSERIILVIIIISLPYKFRKDFLTWEKNIQKINILLRNMCINLPKLKKIKKEIKN